MHPTREQLKQIPRELAARTAQGVEVLLIWRPSDDAVFVVVSDAAAGEQLCAQVDAARALEAYRHPYAHLPAPSSIAVEAA